MKQTQVVLIDDVDQSVATGSVEFSFKGVSYEIDLNDEHMAELQADFDKWIKHATRTGSLRSSRRNTPRRSGGAKSESAAVREWAQAHGIPVNSRGRIPAEIIERYYREHA